MKNVFPVVTEKKARKIIQKGGKVVFVHVKDTCPICDVFLPDVLLPIAQDQKYRDIEFYQINESLTFPVGAHPVTYFFREGYCVQHPSGQAPKETVENLLDTIFLGKVVPLNVAQKPPILEINTDSPFKK
mgnify:CR=1 FL=1